MSITKSKNIKLNTIEIKNIVENLKAIELYQKKQAVLTDCVICQCADILMQYKEINPAEIN